ncbi:MAG: transglutaminase domain-containing protein [Ginsengibacter sp.]
MLLKKKNYVLLLAFNCLIILSLKAQHTNNIKFGKINADDFSTGSTLVDSNTNAVVIADIGSSEFEGNNRGWFTLVYKRIRRIRIISQKGFDAADVSIVLYTDNGYYQDDKNKEILLDLKGATYNITDGKISVTKLDAGSVFETRIDKNRLEKKFTFSSVKTGSIIEYSYTIKSDFIFNLQPWYFQGKYPCLWSEYTVNIPDFFAYIFLSKGYNPFFINEKKTKSAVFQIQDPNYKNSSYGSVPQLYTINSFIAVNRWVIKDVPAVREETMISTTQNYISKIQFQLAQYRFTDPPENKLNTWLTVNKELLGYKDFGQQLDESGWLVSENNKIVDSDLPGLDKAKIIFSFVRDNFANTNNNGIFLTADATLRNIYKSKKGSVSDINLLLIAMLKNAGIKADPVILSTRDHGVVHPVYPILQRYNYTICRTVINGTTYYLDASNHFLGFNKLPDNCFNGIARVISDDTAVVQLSSDSLKEVSTKMIFLSKANGNNLSGTFISTLGDNASLNLREKIANENQETFFKELQKEYPSDILIQNCTIDSLNKYEHPLSIKYKMVYSYNSNDSLVYINPMFGQELKENPFKSELQRLYPVEMPYCPNQLLIVDMEIPGGYKIEEVPKSTRLKLENEDGVFEYIIQQNENRLQLRCMLKINRAIYDAEDYNTLRNFYSYLINKESEQIVLKKVN